MSAPCRRFKPACVARASHSPYRAAHAACPPARCSGRCGCRYSHALHLPWNSARWNMFPESEHEPWCAALGTRGAQCSTARKGVLSSNDGPRRRPAWPGLPRLTATTRAVPDGRAVHPQYPYGRVRHPFPCVQATRDLRYPIHPHARPPASRIHTSARRPPGLRHSRSRLSA
jgi:hypothetical protein